MQTLANTHLISSGRKSTHAMFSFHSHYIGFICYINRNSVRKHSLTCHGSQEKNSFKVTHVRKLCVRQP